MHYHQAPQWLTKEYLQPVLQKYKKDNNISILHLDIKPATAKGENYASVMTRIKVNFRINKQDHEESYIVKTSYENDSYLAGILTPFQVYQTEMEMYDQVLPKLGELLEEIGDTDKLFANTVHVDYKREAIIFEDLSVSNYVTVDRIAGFDMTHTMLALKKLAKMHATAAVLNERTSGSLEKYTRGIYNRHTKGFESLLIHMLQVCTEFAGQCDVLGSYYKEKLIKLKEYAIEYAIRAYNPQPSYFTTLSHGDFWVTNMMLRYRNDPEQQQKQQEKSNKILKDLLLIDFQFCNWSSPGVDLHYFFNTSLQNDLRFNHQDELIQYYYNQLIKTLKALRYNGHLPSLHELQIQLEAGRFYAVTSALVQQPFMINENSEDADFTALLSDEDRSHNFRRMLYKNKTVQENVKRLLPIFDRRGLLDVTELGKYQ